MQSQTAPVVHGFDGINNQVRNNLANLGRKARDLAGVIIAFNYTYLLALELSAVEQENALEKFSQVDGNRR